MVVYLPPPIKMGAAEEALRRMHADHRAFWSIRFRLSSVETTSS
jgi:hypothetical protein